MFPFRFMSNCHDLDRIQVVKGWRDAEGALHEKVHDVAWSDGRKPGADGKLPPVGNTVDLEAAHYTNTTRKLILPAGSWARGPVALLKPRGGHGAWMPRPRSGPLARRPGAQNRHVVVGRLVFP